MERYYYFVDIDSVGVETFNVLDIDINVLNSYMYIIGSDQTVPIPFKFLSKKSNNGETLKFINGASPRYEKKELCFVDIITDTLKFLQKYETSPIIRIISKDENLDYIVKYYSQKGINIRREPSFWDYYDVLSFINLKMALKELNSHYASKKEEEDDNFDLCTKIIKEIELDDDPNFSDMEKN